MVFATVALGMGIDLQDINDVIYSGALSSLEGYFQESGRVLGEWKGRTKWCRQRPLYIGDQWTVQYARSPTLSGIMS